MLSSGALHFPSAASILYSYADVMKVGGNIFCTQKILNNNTNLKQAPALPKDAGDKADPDLKAEENSFNDEQEEEVNQHQHLQFNNEDL